MIHSFTKSVLEIETDLNRCLYLLNYIPDFQLELKKMQSINYYNVFYYESHASILEIWISSNF